MCAMAPRANECPILQLIWRDLVVKRGWSNCQFVEFGAVDSTNGPLCAIQHVSTDGTAIVLGVPHHSDFSMNQISNWFQSTKKYCPKIVPESTVTPPCPTPNAFPSLNLKPITQLLLAIVDTSSAIVYYNISDQDPVPSMC
mmetsp:Transcript_134469/g.233349  ORF Transcript_134469/g.233349 Transcript_134469/m.233349 type:complete len:141 (+) Transcript_134469:18-440(+)